MHEPSQRQTIEEGRAKYAFEAVHKFTSSHAKFPSKNKTYKSYLRKLPSMILTNGLGQALAFLYAKGGLQNKNSSKKQTDGDSDSKEYGMIYRQIETWLHQSESAWILQEKVPSNSDELIYKVVCLNRQHYRLLTKEVLALVGWMSRFADGMTDKDGNFQLGSSATEDVSEDDKISAQS